MTRHGHHAYLARHLDRDGAAFCGGRAVLTTDDPDKVTCENCRAVIRAHRRLADMLPYLRPALLNRIGDDR